MIKILHDGTNWVVFRDDSQYIRLDDVQSAVEQSSSQASFAEMYLEDIQIRAGTTLSPPEQKELYSKLTILYLLVRDGFV